MRAGDRPGSSRPRTLDAFVGALVGLGFAATESALAFVFPAPLDVLPSPAALLGSAAGLGAVHALGAGLLGRSGLVGTVVLWCLVWCFEGPRSAGAPLVWGWVAVGAVVLSGAGAARWIGRPATQGARLSTAVSTTVSTAPRSALALAPWALMVSMLGATWTPAWRPRTQVTPPMATAPGDPPDILLITVDTVRGDAGLLDPWRDEAGWQVGQAVSSAPWTLPALHSVFTGLPVHEHGGGLPTDGAWTQRRRGLRSLVWDFAEAGYETHAVVSNPHLSPDQGFADGFQHWQHFSTARSPLLLLHNLAGLRRRHTGWPEPRRWVRDTTLTQAALAILDAPSAHPRFVWVHLLSPHEYRRTAEAPVPGWAPGTNHPGPLRAAYGVNIGATQARLQQLVAGRQEWTIAITSDHGEALGEHGHWGHGHTLEAAELLVPLALHAAGAPVAWHDDAEGNLSTADLLPALLRAAQGLPLRLPRRNEVAVGGLRDRADFGVFGPHEGTQPVHRSDLSPGSPAVPDPGRRQQLEALGYVLP